MIRDRLIELLKGNLPNFENNVAYWHDEHIGELADYLIANGVTVGNANNATTTWISVEDRLPEPTEYVLLYHPYDGINKGYMFRDKRFHVCIPLPEHPTHWMPLPSEPKGE